MCLAELKICQLEVESREYQEVARYFKSTMLCNTLMAKTYSLNEVFEIFNPELEAEVRHPKAISK